MAHNITLRCPKSVNLQVCPPLVWCRSCNFQRRPYLALAISRPVSPGSGCGAPGAPVQLRFPLSRAHCRFATCNFSPARVGTGARGDGTRAQWSAVTTTATVGPPQQLVNGARHRPPCLLWACPLSAAAFARSSSAASTQQLRRAGRARGSGNSWRPARHRSRAPINYAPPKGALCLRELPSIGRPLLLWRQYQAVSMISLAQRDRYCRAPLVAGTKFGPIVRWPTGRYPLLSPDSSGTIQ